jgi:hypothetical protein
MDMEILTSPEKEARFPKLSEVPYTRTVAAGALITSAVLLFAGKRKAALATAAAGTTLALISEPGAARECWESIPSYIKNAQHFLGKVEDMVEDLAEQGRRAKNLLTK